MFVDQFVNVYASKCSYALSRCRRHEIKFEKKRNKNTLAISRVIICPEICPICKTQRGMEFYNINDPLNDMESETINSHKFGEIYCNFEGKLTFHCVFCPTRMKEANEFVIHYMIHFEDIFVVKAEEDVSESGIQLQSIDTDDEADEAINEINILDITAKPVINFEPCTERKESPPIPKVSRTHRNKTKRKQESSKLFNTPQNCNICGKDFLNKLALERHIECHGIGLLPDMYECDICGRKIKLKKDLLNHMRRTHSGARFPCTLCGKKFTRSCYVSVHMRMHNENRPYQCAVCGKTFVMTGALTSHMRFHDNTLSQCPCLICGKIFNRPGTLAEHIRMHTGEKPFQCNECGSQFRTKRYLNEHKTRHLTVKNFPCDLCGMKFKQPAGVKSHKRKVHGKKAAISKWMKADT